MCEVDATFETEVLCENTARKALRVIPRGKHRLTVYRAHQVSGSVNSIDSGAIFPPRLGHDLSRNASVVSVYALEKNLYTWIGFSWHQKSRDFHEILTFLERCQAAFRKVLGSL